MKSRTGETELPVRISRPETDRKGMARLSRNGAVKGWSGFGTRPTSADIGSHCFAHPFRQNLTRTGLGLVISEQNVDSGAPASCFCILVIILTSFHFFDLPSILLPRIAVEHGLTVEIEFKEKTYEKYFSQELGRLTNDSYSPDQVDEFYLGFDEAFFLGSPSMLLGFPFRRRSRWARLSGVPREVLTHVMASVLARMPPRRFNLFVQYKRPEYMVLPSAGQWSDWRTRYYRYTTKSHQQILLEKIESGSGQRAATIYASPALWRTEDLFNHSQRGEVVANSNIVSVACLTGHSLYSYVDAGYAGKAHSDPVDVESPSLEAIVKAGLESDALPFADHMKRTAALLTEIIGSGGTDYDLFWNARAAILQSDAPEARSDIPAPGTLDDALLTVEAFCDAFDTAFYTLG